MRWIRSAATTVLVVSFLCAVIAPSAGAFSYTLDQISPYVQMCPEWFTPPYFFLLLTNTASTPDDFHLKVENLTQPGWFPSVCLRSVCFPDSITLPFAAGEADTVGVQIAPDFLGQDEVGEWDFVLNSVGDPGLSTTIHMTMYSGASANDVQVVVSMPGYELRQNFPNPARGNTDIAFVLPRENVVELGVFDLAGRLVEVLESGAFPAGTHRSRWDGLTATGTEAPAGVYFYRLETPTGELTKKMTLIR